MNDGYFWGFFYQFDFLEFQGDTEKSIEVAKEKNIEKIYYIDIWDDDGNEILRDKYILHDG